MKNVTKSIWSDTAELSNFQALEGDKRTDVLVVGGGMAGLLCAYLLKRNGISCIVAEGDAIGRGITKNTTAVVSAQHDILYGDLINKYGTAKAKHYLNANLKAVAKFRELSADIDCDFENRPSYIFSQTDRDKMQNEVNYLSKLGYKAEFNSEIPLPIPIAGAVKFPDQGQFHPLKFIKGISSELDIYEHTFVNKIVGNTAFTDRGKITAENIIIASHYPFINSHGLYFLKLYQKRSYIIALEGAADIGGTYADNRENGMYFRNYKNLLLIGGGDHRTGGSGGGFDELRSFAKTYYPNAFEKYSWSNQDCMSLDGVPYIGRYGSGKNMSGVFVATGFNEWGMTSSMVSAFILSDKIAGRDNEFADVFSPDRSILTKQLWKNIGVTALNFIKPSVKRCPHLGCSLKRNKLEGTWDCPCHGSRFDSDGKLIDNPAMKDAHIK